MSETKIAPERDEISDLGAVIGAHLAETMGGEWTARITLASMTLAEVILASVWREQHDKDVAARALDREATRAAEVSPKFAEWLRRRALAVTA